jgi:Protein of unknown function (DUF1345)
VRRQRRRISPISRLVRAFRWPPTITLCIAAVITVVLPARYPFLPPRVSQETTGVLGVLVVIAIATHVYEKQWRLERPVTIAMFVVVTLLTLAAVASLIARVVFTASEALSGVALLQASVAAWVFNVLTFAQWYWLIDTNGTSTARAVNPDFLFPQRGLEATFPKWQPQYADYLALAFTTATAFSPTDVLPASTRAKGLMVVEAGLSLVVISISAARAVGALG